MHVSRKPDVDDWKKSRQVILQNSKQNKNAYMRLFLTKGEPYVENDSLIFLKPFDEVNEELSYNL